MGKSEIVHKFWGDERIQPIRFMLARSPVRPIRVDTKSAFIGSVCVCVSFGSVCVCNHCVAVERTISRKWKEKGPQSRSEQRRPFHYKGRPSL